MTPRGPALELIASGALFHCGLPGQVTKLLLIAVGSLATGEEWNPFQSRGLKGA
jgi:hypothetical protein